MTGKINVKGHSIVSFDIIDGMILNPKVEKSLSETIDTEILRCLVVCNNKAKHYGPHLNTKSYKLDINFIVDDGKNDRMPEKAEEKNPDVIRIDVTTMGER